MNQRASLLFAVFIFYVRYLKVLQKMLRFYKQTYNLQLRDIIKIDMTPGKNITIKAQQWRLLAQYFFSILPRVEMELQKWRQFLLKCSPSPLRQQALNSIRDKKFHCQGGAFGGLLNPAACSTLVSLIVSFQTISDYLDNLCDRVTWKIGLPFKESDSYREKSFRRLHCSMLLSISPGSENLPSKEFYRYYPFHEDEGYLKLLVKNCQNNIALLPFYHKVKEKVLFLTRLYCDLQSLKHLSPKFRDKYLQNWFRVYKKNYPFLFWQEFAAAAGSTLGTFVLFALASRQNCSTAEAEKIFNCYFPWICGLHILLDYFIDQQEDRKEGDLNFIFYYQNPEQCHRRLIFFIEKAMENARKLDNPTFHCTVVKGLLALYLSDPKVKKQKLEKVAHTLLAAAGERDVFFMYHLCCFLRKLGAI